MQFSSENIEIIQNGIRAGVFKMSNQKHIIDKQDYDQIKIIMRSVFLQYSLNQPDNISEQIQSLNNIVLEYCIPKIHSELVSYLKYKEDITTLPVPQDNPVFLGVDKTVELKNFFLIHQVRHSTCLEWFCSSVLQDLLWSFRIAL